MRSILGKAAGPARKRPSLDISPTLVVDGVAIVRGGRRVLEAVDFRLEPGGALELTGPNGAGKSTLLRALAGLLPLAAGHVHLQSADGADDAPVAERVHLVGHADGLKSALTARENLAFAAALAGGGPAPHATPIAALERLGLGAIADLPVAFLSAGQRRRVALGRLLTARRPLWLLDEPLNALDTAAQETLRAILGAHRAAGGLVVAATHVPLGMPEARAMRLAP